MNSPRLPWRGPLALWALALSACAAAGTAAPSRAAPALRASAEQEIAATLDDLHDAAAKADEERYFAHYTADAVFLGTDATERWELPAFRAFAHPYFARGKAWSFQATRRAVVVGPGGEVAWFDEELATPNLGPSRGSGVLLRQGGAWKVAHYNLTVTVPNARLAEVKKLLEGR